MLESLRPVFSTELHPLHLIKATLVGIQVEALILLAVAAAAMHNAPQAGSAAQRSCLY